VRTSQYGDFVGVNLRILATAPSAVPTLGPVGALALAALLLAAALRVGRKSGVIGAEKTRYG
jgi:hypothetical protein